MKASTKQIVPIIAMMTVVVMGFQNCGPTRFTQDGGTASMKSIDATDVIVPAGDDAGPEVPVVADDGGQGKDADKQPEKEKEPVIPRDVASDDGDDSEDSDSDLSHHRSCVKGQLSAPVAVDATAVDRLTMNGKGNVDLGVVRNLILGNHHGHVTAVASEATISNLKGKLNLSAKSVISAKNIFNHACISAEKIGELNNFDHKLSVRAKEIELIANVQNKVVISGAIVKKISNVPKGACLIDGAQVLVVENSGPVGKCD